MYQTKAELLQGIQERFPDLGRGQKRVAQYVLAHTEEVAFLTAAQLGKNVGVSEATVVRFAALLDYDGFPDFQTHIQNMMRQDISTITRLEKRAEQQATQGSKSILQAILEADQTNLTLFASDTTEKTFTDAVEMIGNAREIYICGLRSSHSVALFLWFSLRYFLRKVHLITPGIGDLPEQLLSATDQDIFIGINMKRYSRVTVEIAKALKKHGVKILSIADNIMSPLTPLADVQFTVRSDVSSFIESQVVTMSLSNALVTAIALQHKAKTVEELSRLESSFDEFETYAM
ncbi:transcriptional regulator, RpiR family [Candidatus Moduliflexus flocculans]|uniref:Transcriptional regulator, RpiR family n=1 Tax=Candidatus Moduliflexus flocculans TaxID=1499966 RepID=A0A081BN49_9BACT|nr:transcriptional regulator, RpiR family [Candidatus Moduliflexus flocculans]